MGEHHSDYRRTSLIRNSTPIGPYSRTMSRVLWWFKGGRLFLMSEVPLYGAPPSAPFVQHSIAAIGGRTCAPDLI